MRKYKHEQKLEVPLMKKTLLRAQGLWLVLALLLLTSCGRPVVTDSTVEQAYPESVPMEEVQIEAEAVPLGMAAVPDGMMPVASGLKVEKNQKAMIDYSNIVDGYVMVQYTASTDKKLKAQVKGPSGVAYTYNLTAGNYETLPLTDGNGSYKVSLFENISGTSYSTVVSTGFSVTLKDQFAPFLRPNQYVNYTPGSKVVAKADELTKGVSEPLDKVSKVYDYVVKNFTYDKQRAATVQSGYLPVLDSVLAQKKGICFDFAAVMAAMLRSQGVPTKLVVGYSQSVYHAWINVYSEETGWVDGAVYFDGTNWKLMDPTFASSGKQSKQIMEYIANGANYTDKYLY